MKHAIFSGRFDPMTLGHLDIIVRAAKQFEQLTVAVVSDTAASTRMPLASRIAAVVSACEDISGIEVISFDGLLVECACLQGVQTIIRGLRSSDDFQYEYRMAMMNQSLAPDLDTLFLMSSPSVIAISATLVRQILSHQGDVTAFVPKAVLPYIYGGIQWH